MASTALHALYETEYRYFPPSLASAAREIMSLVASVSGSEGSVNVIDDVAVMKRIYSRVPHRESAPRAFANMCLKLFRTSRIRNAKPARRSSIGDRPRLLVIAIEIRKGQKKLQRHLCLDPKM